MTEKIKVVLAGCGGMSGAWLKSATGGGKFDVVGLVDINEAAAHKRKEEFGLQAAQTGDSLATMLKATGAEAVFDCTIPKAHKEVTLTALAHGCHILGEKPIAENLEDARQMVDAARKSGRIYAVIQNRRYIPSIRAVRDFIAEGTLGRLTTLDVDFYLGAHFGGFREEMEHVLLVDMAIHTFDMARFISGADPVSVYCKEWNPSGSWYQHGASAVAIFEMSNGLVFTYRGSWCAEGMNTTWEGAWRMVCENGSATWDGANDIRAQKPASGGKFISDMADIKVEVPEHTGPTGHGALIEEFGECIRTGWTPQTICTDNIKSFGMVMAAVQSAESGRPVPVEF
jgi:predicted dehydrogenase